MWRSEPNTFVVRTRPPPLDQQYSTTATARHGVTSAHDEYSSNANYSNTQLLSSASEQRWFHIPGSGLSPHSANSPISGHRGDVTRYGVAAVPDGLVASHLHQSHSSIAAVHSATAGAPSPPSPPNWTSAMYNSRGGVESTVPADSPSPISLLAASPSSEVSRLLRQYRDENNRLREQLHAKALHESHLLAKLEELSRQHALLQLQCQRTCPTDPRHRSHEACHDGVDDDDGAPLVEVDENVGALLRGGSSAGTAKHATDTERRLREKEEEVRELEGRLAAYKEALERSRAYNTTTDNKKKKKNHATASPAQEKYDDEDEDDADADASKMDAPSLSAVLLESLQTADYLVKVVNALQHCQQGTHSTSGLPGDGEVGSCPRSREQCTRKCLQAAVKGAVHDAELLPVLAGGPENDSEEQNREAALAVREELSYCETVVVRLAAALLARQQQQQQQQPVRAEAEAEAERRAAVQTPLASSRASARGQSTPSTSSASPPPSATVAGKGSVQQERGENTDAARQRSAGAGLAQSRKGRHSRCRPDIEDCEVQ